MDEIKTSLDLYLLRVLHTLLTEGSVTRAAAKLNQSQPAVSAALRRLRDINGDPLLVRSRSGMVPTEYGAALLDPVRNALREIDRIVPYRTDFDPLRSVRTFKIGSPDYLNVLFLPTVVRSFRRQAPGARLEWHSLNPVFDYERALETGQLDLAIGNWPEPPEGLHRSDLFADRMVCLMSDKHPGASEPLTPAQADRVGELHPVTGDENLDENQEGKHSGCPHGIGLRLDSGKSRLPPRNGVESKAASWAKSAILARDVSRADRVQSRPIARFRPHAVSWPLARRCA